MSRMTASAFSPPLNQADSSPQINMM